MRLGRPDGRAIAFENTVNSRTSTWRLIYFTVFRWGLFLGTCTRKRLSKQKRTGPGIQVDVAI